MMGEINDFVNDGISIEGQNNFTISFNTNYFLDIVKLLASECEEINIQLSGALGPVLIDNQSKKDYLYVLVPLRTNN